MVQKNKSNQKAPQPIRRKRLPIVIGAVALLAVIAGAAWLALRPKDQPAAAGRLGVFVERFNLPEADALQSETIDSLSKSLRSAKPLNNVEVRPLVRSIEWSEVAVEELDEQARKLNASAIVGVAAPDEKTREIVVYLRFPEPTKDFPRPDLERLTSSMVYPKFLSLPQARQAEWVQAATLLKAHLLLGSGFGAGISPHLQASLPKPAEGAGATSVNYGAGSFALACAISASGGTAALEQAIQFLTRAHADAQKNKDESLVTPATINLAVAHLMRNSGADSKRAAELMESLRDVIGGYPDTQVQAVASMVRCQTVLAQLAPDVNPKKTVANLVTVMEKLQQEWPRAKHPYAYAATELFKARALSRLADSGDASAIESGINALRNVLEIYKRNPYPGEWANAQGLLGSLYGRRREGNRATNARVAIECYSDALKVWTPQSTPREWARDLVARATVRLGAQEDDYIGSIRQSIADLEKALQVVTRENDPLMWARIQNTLGAAWRQLPASASSYQKAIDHFKAALLVRKPEAFPMEAAHTLANLGNAYRDYPAEPGQEERYLNLALKAYEAATRALEQSLDQSFQTEIDKNRQLAERELIKLNSGSATQPAGN